MSVKPEKVSFEQALNATGFGKFNIIMLLMCSFLIIAMVFEAMSISFLVSASACELHTTSVQQGLAAGLPIVGVIIMSHVWGYLADTRGRRKILLVSQFIGFLTGVLSAFSPNWIVLTVLKMFSCSAVSGTFALSMTMLSECTPQARRSLAIILSTSVFMLSNGLMAIIAIPVLPLTFSYHISFLNIYFNSWRLLGIIFTLPCVLGMTCLYFSVESPKYLLSIEDEEGTLKVLKTIYSINSGKTSDSYDIKSIYLDEDLSAAKVVGLWASMKSQTLPLLKPPLLKNTLILSLLFVGVYVCVNPYIIWLPTMADSFMRAVETGETGLTFCQMQEININTTTTDEPNSCVLNKIGMLMIFGISLLLATLTSMMSVLLDRIGRKRLLIGIQFTTAVVGYVINFSTSSVLSAVLFIIYLAPTLDIGILTTFAVDFYPTHLRAMAVCLTLMLGRGSAIVGINLLKYLLVNNCPSSFYVFSSITLFCGVVACFLPPDERKKKTNEIGSK